MRYAGATQGDSLMATFITHAKFSQEAAKALLSNPQDRHEAVSKLCESVGAKLIHYYITTGEYDVLLITEADDASMAIEAAMIAAAAGTVSAISTSRAWSTAEFKSICERAGKAAGMYVAPGG